MIAPEGREASDILRELDRDRLEQIMLHRHRIGIFLAAFVLGTIASHGQITGTKTLGEELTRLESSKHGDDIVLGDIPEYFVAPQKTKAIIKAIDLEARTIKVIPIKKNGSFRVAQINEHRKR